jgi:hypothetical protein
MNDSGARDTLQDAMRDMSREEIMSALFGHMVIQNTNMALMFLGQAPHPETGERVRDFEAARLFIDQLEMLEAKTKGNLNHEEEKLLQQSLMHLRMTFVQAIENAPKEKAIAAEAPTTAEAAPAIPVSESPGASIEDEPRKRFSKKF